MEADKFIFSVKRRKKVVNKFVKKILTIKAKYNVHRILLKNLSTLDHKGYDLG